MVRGASEYMRNETEQRSADRGPARSFETWAAPSPELDVGDVTRKSILRYVSQIDLEELMRALKLERSAKTVLSKGKAKVKGNHGPVQQRPEQEQNASGSDDFGDDHEKSAESAEENNVSTTKESRSDNPVGDEELECGGEGGGSSPRAREKVDKEERPLFAPQEAESLTAYLVEGQQAFSLINVADIQRGEPEADSRTAVV